MSSHETDSVVSALTDLCRRMKVQCLVQIGAGDGYEAFHVHSGVGCRTIAIEANPNAKSCDPRLEFHHLVIGATDGVTQFYFQTNADLSGQIPRSKNDEPAELPGQRLDTFCSARGLTPDALIIDTEGTTMEVLEGCGHLLRNVRLIYAEVQGAEIRPGIRTAGQVEALLTPHGFTRHDALPSYGGWGAGQFNQTWVRP